MIMRKWIVSLATLALLLTLALFGAPNLPIANAAVDSGSMHLRQDPAARLEFTSHGQVVSFGSTDWALSNGSYALRVGFVGAHEVVPVSAGMTSNDKQKVAPLERVTYANLWNGITLMYRAPTSGIVESVYRIDPNADASAIRLHYNAPVTVRSDGTLAIAYATGEVNETAPVAWQEISGQRMAVTASFVAKGEREVGFAVGAHDPQAALTIDPVLTWNTFLGEDDTEIMSGIAVDGSGNVYVGGTSTASWGTPIRAFSGSSDAFAAKLDSGGGLVWNTFLGGSADDGAVDIAVDGSGNVYVPGSSSATWGTPVRAYTGGITDSFVAKVDTNGALVWNTFLGGSGDDHGWGVAVDGSGNVFVAGSSKSTWGTPVRAYSSDYDSFAAKLGSTGALIWNTFLGGSALDWGSDIAVDGSGNVYVAGASYGSWGTPVRAYTSGADGFAAKLNSTGALTWNTFLGGSGEEFASYAEGIAVDGSGNVYVSGASTVTWGTPVRAFTPSAADGFAAKLGSTGALTWNTFLGGSGYDEVDRIAVDSSGNVYVSGSSTASWGAPVRPYTTSQTDAFATKVDSTGALTWNTFVGGTGLDQGLGIAIDGTGNVFLSGTSEAGWGSPIRAYTSGIKEFVAKIPAVPDCVQIPEKPLPIKPANNKKAKGPAVKLDWSDTACATSYQVTVRQGSTKGAKVFKKGGLKTSNAVTTPLTKGATYYWQVVAKNSLGKTKSDWFQFTVK